MNHQWGNRTGGRDACSRCASALDARFDRRRVLRLAVGGFAAASLTPRRAFAGGGAYEAMLLSCIDPRFQEPVSKYTAGRGLTGKYSQFTIAGASIGVVAPAFEGWHETFWDNLGASVELHEIAKVIVVNHRDCGAAEIAYGQAAVATAAAETETHRAVLTEFRGHLADRHPGLGVETGLMALDGEFEVMS